MTRLIRIGFFALCAVILALWVMGLAGCACKEYLDGSTKCYVTTSD